MPGLLLKAPNVDFPDRCLGLASDCPERPPATPFLRIRLPCWQRTAGGAKHILFSADRVIYKPSCFKAISSALLFFRARLQEPASIPNEPHPRLASFSAVRETWVPMSLLRAGDPPNAQRLQTAAGQVLMGRHGLSLGSEASFLSPKFYF